MTTDDTAAPARVYVETTTRCNLRCGMCVKQAEGCGIDEGDFDPALMDSMLSAMKGIGSLVLSGIGEPLLYPHLEEIIRKSRQKMPESGRIGFQTNGILLNDARAISLIDAGLDRVCISVDAVDPALYGTVRTGGTLAGIERAFAALKTASSAAGREVETGIEFVLTLDTMDQLTPAVRWAAAHGASFVIVTHLIAYHPGMAGKVAYDRNTDGAVELFEMFKRHASSEGIDIHTYFTALGKHLRSPDEERVVRFVDEMMEEAHARKLFLNLRGILEREESFTRTIEKIFGEARRAAAETGMSLELPEVLPKSAKRCEFIETGSAFISWNGDVHPCHFLWHRYRCHVSGRTKYVNPRVFGNLADRDLLDIWHGREYREFRETVARYDYPVCSNCTWAPCDYIYAETFEQDCYANTIPCCDCQWCLGIFRCMG